MGYELLYNLAVQYRQTKINKYMSSIRKTTNHWIPIEWAIWLFYQSINVLGEWIRGIWFNDGKDDSDGDNDTEKRNCAPTCTPFPPFIFLFLVYGILTHLVDQVSKHKFCLYSCSFLQLITSPLPIWSTWQHSHIFLDPVQAPAPSWRPLWFFSSTHHPWIQLGLLSFRLCHFVGISVKSPYHILL